MLPTMVLASAAKSRLVVSPMEQAARAVGDQLFRALTGGETLGELARLRRRAQAAGADVRLALRVRPPELAALPWEYLFDAREDRREFLGRSCMVTRSAGDLRTVPPLAVSGPLRVLAMVAEPGDQAVLDVARERAYLEAALAPMSAAGRLELAWVPATKQALLSATQRQRWHIVHYIGHGDFDAATGAGRLAFAAEAGDGGGAGGTDWVTARQLATILGAHPTLRLVVLNACQSSAGSSEDGQAGLAAALVHAGLAAVVAMQFPITDDAAPVFGREFYGALAAGQPVDRCVRAGRAAITLANDASLEWGTPVLHLRSADGTLFAMAEPAAAEPTSAGSAVARTPVAEPAPGRATADGSRAEPDGGRGLAESGRASESWHTAGPPTAGPPTDAEPWRPEPETPAGTGRQDRPGQSLGTDQTLLQQLLSMDMTTATESVMRGDFSSDLVAMLEDIVRRYAELRGAEHESTNRARTVLSQARSGLEDRSDRGRGPGPRSPESPTPPTPPTPPTTTPRTTSGARPRATAPASAIAARRAHQGRSARLRSASSPWPRRF
ncbi:CHAT domain-containing protein [Catenulispora yoronensis]